MSKFSAYIIEWRHYIGLSQKELAGILKLSQQYINDLERGRRNPSNAVLQKLVQSTGLDRDYLYWLTGRFSPDLTSMVVDADTLAKALGEFRTALAEAERTS
jgi:transcriptional regulator with XRE-family HTH domain